MCPANPQEVCGGDGVTYACKEVPQQKGIAVLNTGACKQIDPRKLFTTCALTPRHACKPQTYAKLQQTRDKSNP